MRVGLIKIDTPALLAPMAAVTDLPFRTVCEQLGAGFTVTEFLSADALSAGDPKSLAKLTASLNDRPFGVQIYGREVEPMIQAAHMAVDIGASLVDINMGCPKKRVVAGACGSALMRTPDLAQTLVRAVASALPDGIPLTVKTRAGWDRYHLNAPEFACAMVEAGAQMITVHGRTRDQGFAGESDLEIIRRVREQVPGAVPVVGNGDVVDVPSYIRMRKVTGCDAVMIGRGALGNPWLFQRIRDVSRGLADPGPPSLAERVAVFRQHTALIQRLKGGRKLVHELRKACAWYAKSLRGCNSFRERVWKIRDPDDVLAAAEAFFAGSGEQVDHSPAAA